MDDLFGSPIDPESLSALASAASRIADVFEGRIAPALEKIAQALERNAGGVASRTEAAVPIPTAADVRKAILEQDVIRAEAELQSLLDANPEAPEAARLQGEIVEKRRVMAEDRRKRLDASRSANDPEAAIEHRDALHALLDPSEIEAIDRDLVRWLMGLLMKRMRAGTVREDVAKLAAKASESFGHLPEGASLRASLPTLRRSAGLCPKCGGTYAGAEDSCDQCSATGPKIADLPPPAVAAT